MASLDIIAIVGAGAWGVALANAIARAGRRVLLVGRDEAVARRIAATRISPRLPGVRLANEITVTGDAAQITDADAVLVVTPAQALRAAMAALAPHLRNDMPVIACAKGIERGTRRFMTEIIAATAPQASPAILSGPSFADDVARGLPTAVTLACAEEAAAERLAAAIGSPSFRPYYTTDLRGVEIGGASKNVLAIAAGIAIGKRLGASAVAALITRGFAELMRFGIAYGARPETLSGLSGLGDLVLTCSSPQSRNLSLGIALGDGRSLQEACAGKLAEGAFTAQVLGELARERGVDMPISAAVAGILEGGLDVDTAIRELLARPFRAER